MKFNVKTTIRLDDARVRRKLGDANARALKIAGMRVQEKTQRSMSSRSPLKNPKLWKIAEKQGEGGSSTPRRDRSGRFVRDRSGPRELVALITRVPVSDKVTSWKTGRNAKGFLRNDVRYAFDQSRGSVVIGPATLPKLNQLQEFGGTTPVYFYATRGGPKRSRKFKNPIYGRLTARRSGTPLATFTKSLKKRGYMSKGLQAARPQIPLAFRDTLKGP